MLTCFLQKRRGERTIEPPNVSLTLELSSHPLKDLTNIHAGVRERAFLLSESEQDNKKSGCSRSRGSVVLQILFNVEIVNISLPMPSS